MWRRGAQKEKAPRRRGARSESGFARLDVVVPLAAKSLLADLTAAKSLLADLAAAKSLLTDLAAAKSLLAETLLAETLLAETLLAETLLADLGTHSLLADTLFADLRAHPLLAKTLLAQPRGFLARRNRDVVPDASYSQFRHGLPDRRLDLGLLGVGELDLDFLRHCLDLLSLGASSAKQGPQAAPRPLRAASFRFKQLRRD